MRTRMRLKDTELMNSPSGEQRRKRNGRRKQPELLMSENEMRELDIWITTNIMGIAVTYEECKTFPGVKLPTIDGWKHPPQYTVERALAMEVLEKCAVRCDIRVQEDNKEYAVLASDEADMMYSRAKTLPLAICLFAKQLFSQSAAKRKVGK